MLVIPRAFLDTKIYCTSREISADWLPTGDSIQCEVPTWRCRKCSPLPPLRWRKNHCQVIGLPITVEPRVAVSNVQFRGAVDIRGHEDRDLIWVGWNRFQVANKRCGAAAVYPPTSIPYTSKVRKRTLQGDFGGSRPRTNLGDGELRESY